MPRQCCAHCGLPVVACGRSDAGPVFCCYGCYLAARIVGRQDGEGVHAWNLLRLGLGALLAMNVMMLALLLYTGAVEAQAAGVFRWLMMGLAAPAMVILGYPFMRGAAGEIVRRRLSLDTLIAVGSLAAFAVSVYDTVRGDGPVYFDTATMLPALVTFGKLLEATAKSRAGSLTRSLRSMLPATARRVEEAGPREVAASDIRVGDRLRVLAGERFAADGRIVEGATQIDEAAFTGEPQPRLCGPGDEVVAGTVNGPGAVAVEAVRVGDALLLHRIIDMIDEARQTASPSERIAERAAAAFVPAVLTLAAAAGAFWFWTDGPARAGFVVMAVLAVACPCAMGIAAPLATAIAMGRAARSGVLVRGGDVMERVGRAGAVLFDKTGTLTTGRPTDVAIESLDPGATENEVLSRVAALETLSDHHLARGIVAEARRRGLAIGQATRMDVSPGMGISGPVTWRGSTCEVRAGTAAFVRSGNGKNAVISSERSESRNLAVRPAEQQQPQRDPSTSLGVTARKALPENSGAPVRSPAAMMSYVGWGGRVRGRIILNDVIRPDAEEAVRRLHGQGIATALVSGDRVETGRAVASQLGIGHVEAPRRPDGKIDVVRDAMRHLGVLASAGGRKFSRDSKPALSEVDGRSACSNGTRAPLRVAAKRAGGAGSVVVMVGDGVNDAPAMATADVGIALAAGTDLTRETGHVVLLGNRLARVPWLVALSRHTRRIITQNLAWAFGYNAIALAAAAAGLLHPLLAAVAMVVSSLTVLANSLRIQRFPDE